MEIRLLTKGSLEHGGRHPLMHFLCLTSKKKIRTAYDYIMENSSYYSVDYSTHIEIDDMNILQATQKSMHKSIYHVITQLVNDLKEQGTFTTEVFDKIELCIDGNYFKPFQYFYENQFYMIKDTCLIKGDEICKEISAASILAKVSSSFSLFPHIYN